MGQLKCAVGNMMFLSVAKVCTTILGFFYITLSARYLGPENYGILTFALALTGIFSVLANFGFDPLMVREVAKNQESASKFIVTGLVLKLVCGAVTVLGLFLIVSLLEEPGTAATVVNIMSLSVVLLAISNIFSNIYQAFHKMLFLSVTQVICSLSLLLFAVVGISLNLSVMFFALSYLFANLILLVLNILIVSHKLVNIRCSIDYQYLGKITKDAWPFALSAIFISIYYWIDSIMLSYMKGDQVVGLYGAAYNLMIYSLLVPVVFNTVIFPLMASSTEMRDGLNRLFEHFLRYMIILSVTLGIFIIVFASQIVSFVYGIQYAQSATALQILIFSAMFIYLNSPFGRVLEILNKQRVIMVVTACGAVFNIIANLIVIPIYSFYGASLTTALTELLILILLAIYVRYIGVRSSNQIPLTFMKVIISAAIGLLTYHVGTATVGDTTGALLAICIYISLLLLLRVPNDYDINIIRTIMKRDRHEN